MYGGLKEERPPHPRANANFFEILTFGWILKLFQTGKKRDLEINDLYSTLKDHSSSLLGNELEKKWRIELAKAKESNRHPSLLRALLEMFGPKLMLYGFLLLIIETVLCVCQSIFLGRIIAQFKPNMPPDQSSRFNGIFYGFCLIVAIALKTFGSIAYDMLTVHMGMKMRVSTCFLTYNKALRLSKSALDKITVGHALNLVSNDVNRFDTAIMPIHYLWISPIQTMVFTYFLWQEIGMSSVIGVVVIFIFIPFQVWLGKKISELRLKTALRTDKRLGLMNEIISGIQVIKMYTWEKPFQSLVQYARKKEIQQIRAVSYVRSIMSSFLIFHTKIALFSCILLYNLLGNFITAQKVFVITLYYNILRITMTFYFPVAIGQISELFISIKRLQNFLLYEEKNTQVATRSKADEVKKPIVINDEVSLNNLDNLDDSENMSNLGIDISNATAKWTDTQNENSLENINLTVRQGRLVAIIGPVGAGKSSLIQAILKELPLAKGNISVCGVISYASQEPWLFDGSIQQNILFGSPMDEERYKKIINVCALKTDFEQLSYGDRTIVGERGVSLSGGQKARINLARAIYRQADIYLLDDPLSAVDTHVGKHLFDKCIKGYLKEKTCILITHQLQYLTKVDQIILMENANIVAEGSHNELQASGLDFTKLLSSSVETNDIFENESIQYTNSSSMNPKSNLPQQNSDQSDNKMALSHDERKQYDDFQKEPMEVAETRSSGNISLTVYSSYYSAGGNVFIKTFLLLTYIITQVLISGEEYWITFWVNLEEHVFQHSHIVGISNLTTVVNSTYANTYNSTTTTDEISGTLLWSNISRKTCILVLAILIFSIILATFFRSVTLVSFSMKASMNLHNKMFNAITRATMCFFNTNSSGRILNRFSKDMGTIDETIPFIFIDCIQIGLRLLGMIIMIGIVNIYLIFPIFIIGIIFYKLRVFYLSTYRSIKRLEGVTRSPVFMHLKASLQGLATIRAFEAEQILSKEFDNRQDLNSSAWYLNITSSRAFGFWLDTVCLILLSFIIFSFLVISNNTYGGNVGLAITQAIGLTGLFQLGMKQTAELENQMTSVERVLEYTNAPQESALESSPGKKPPKEWPQKGQIVFKNFYLRYSPDTPHVLKNLNIKIEPMEKVGIVGRTGAGKSSLIGALFRLALNEGSICIDDLDINKLGLHELRSKISIIPQEPVLFSGTMRKNLDPFDEFPDHALWNALDEVELKDVIEDLPRGLNSKMSEGGSNFSVGQRQLVCLARAIVRNNKILVLDEATANVDLQTDALIQNTIRNKFRMCTFLTIAHRLNTVMDSDKVLVMDAGKMVEFDHPYILLKIKDGYLYKMVEQTGKATADLLHSVAAESYNTLQSTKESPIRLIDEDFDDYPNKND